MPSSVNAASLGGGGGASNNDNANNNGNGGSDDGVRNEEEVCSSYAQRLLANFNQLRQQNCGLCDVELVPGFISASTATTAAAAAASSTATEPASSPEDSSSSPGFSSLLRPPPTPTNRTFLAHRTVLAAASPYFNAMFTSDLAEARRARVVLRSVGDRALSELLDFVYTGRVRVTRENVQVRGSTNFSKRAKSFTRVNFHCAVFLLLRFY